MSISSPGPLRHPPALCRHPCLARVAASGTMPPVTPGLWLHLGDRASVWPGRHHPLGASWSPESTNFAVHAPSATAVWVCLFDDDGVESRHQLTEQSLGIWHGALPDVAPGTRYGFRADGPWQPELGLRFNVDKLLLDPFARAISGDVTYQPAIFGHDLDAPRAAQPGRLRAVRAAQRRGRSRRLRLAGRPAASAPLARHRHLRGAREGDDPAPRPGARGAAGHVRRSGHPGGGRLPEGPRGDGGGAAADPPVRVGAGAGRARDWSTTGATTRSVSSPRTTPTPPPATAGSRSPSSSTWCGACTTRGSR